MPGTGCVAASGVSSAVNEVITLDVVGRMERARRALTVTRVARRTGLRRVLAEIGVAGHREATREAAQGFRQALLIASAMLVPVHTFRWLGIVGFCLAGVLGLYMVWKIIRTPGEL